MPRVRCFWFHRGSPRKHAALWCFYNTDHFRDAILKAVNLGDDADTTAAVCGQIAGAYYGREGIPEAWVQRLTKRDLIESLAERLYEYQPGNAEPAV